MLTSVIIRTFNEEAYLDELLRALGRQECSFSEIEIILVDSGSTDATLEIAARHNCHITHISQSEFSFGRSLNTGCEFADGDYLVFISGHCIPVGIDWIEKLVSPLRQKVATYSYGRQLGRDTTKFSEAQYFEKAFPAYSKVPQRGYFCNNANSAISRKVWEHYRFDEKLSGLEDMDLAQRLEKNDLKIAYIAEAPVYHIHDESWTQLRTRYEREAHALHQIMPQLHFTFGDFFRYFISGLMSDSAAALSEKCLVRELPGIFMFRLMHYWGTYKGNHQVRQLSAEMKHRYFYPIDVEKKLYDD